MGRWRLAAGLMIAVVLTAFAGAALAQEEDVDQQTAEAQRRVGELRDEISLVNLVNGLNLTEDQLTKMITVLKEAQAVRDEYKAKNKQLLSDVEKAFTDLRCALNDGPILPPDISKRAGDLKEKVEGLKDEFQAKISSYGPKVTAHLTDCQLEVVDTFKPCLLPPKNQKNPVRVGQASDNEHQIALLRRLREMPKEKYDAAKKDIVAKGLEKYQERKGKFSAEEIEKETKRLMDVCDKVRALSPEEFELQKEEFGECSKPLDKMEELKDEIKEVAHERDPGFTHKKAAGFFLNPKMLGVLEERLVLVKNFKAPTGPGLNGGTCADSGTAEKPKE